MRRYSRTIALIVVLIALSVLVLGFQTISIGGFERGSDTILGLNLGLDLQGGSHLVYQAVDPETGEPIDPESRPSLADDMKQLKRSIEGRVNAAGLGDPNIQILGKDRLLIQLAGADPARAKSLIGETARLEIKHRTLNVPRDIQSVSLDNIVSVRVENLDQISPFLLGGLGGGPLGVTSTRALEALLGSTSMEALQSLLGTTSTEALESLLGSTSTDPATSTATGTAGTTTAPALQESVTGTPVLIVEFTEEAAADFATIVDELEQSLEPIPGTGRIYTNILTIAVEGETPAPLRITYVTVAQAADGQIVPFGDPNVRRLGESNSYLLNVSLQLRSLAEAEERFGENPRLKLGELLGKVDTDVGLTGEDLARAYPGQHAGTGIPIVNLEFNGDGTRKFAELTARIAGTPDVTPFILDDEELMAPTADVAITRGTAYITSPNFTFDRVKELALLLESGRLPLPVELIQERSIDAILGADSLKKSVTAGVAGLLLVLLFMVMYYRVPGLVAASSLLIYALFVLAIFKTLPITMTLSGVAAAILSIGMAVDANILIFERMKEELRAGRTLLSAVNIGFNRAWPAIRDSNVSTLITCAILFWFADTLGATIVQGFAVALAVGVGVSMFSAITVSRTLLRLTAATRLARRLDLYVPAGAGDLPQQRQAVVAEARE